MQRWTAITLLAISWTLVMVPSHSSAQDQDRKVATRVMPSYPRVAKAMGLKGTVKVEVVVAPNGTVKSVAIKGGHPVLAEAATDAVRKWKWVPAAHETKESVLVKFDPADE